MLGLEGLGPCHMTEEPTKALLMVIESIWVDKMWMLCIMFIEFEYLTAKQLDSGDLYDVITQCGMALENLMLRPKVNAAGVHMPLHRRW